MDFLALLSLKAKAEALNLASPTSAVMAILAPFGFTDEKTVESVLSVARSLSSDPSQSIASFVQEGGLVKMMAGPQTKTEDAAIECPHCGGVIFLSVS